MRENEVMEQLAALGTEQIRKTYRRHGATGEVLGVLYSDLRKLHKRCGTDQALAEALWGTGIHDARMLATMVADPAIMAEPVTGSDAAPGVANADAAAPGPGYSSSQASGTDSGSEPKIGSPSSGMPRIPRIGTWGAQVDNRPLLASVAELAAKTPIAVDTLNTWIASGSEWLAATGWHVLAILASRGNGAPEGVIDDAAYGRYLQQIESTIHGSPNWVRHAMNGALIAIGLRSQELQAEALAAAQRIGKVVVDHGQTACKTPDAISYIRRAVLRRSENTNEKKKITANEEPQMTDTMTQSSNTKRNTTESAPKTSTKRAAGGQTAAKKASKKAAKKAGAKKAAKKAGARPAKKAAKKAGARPAKKAGAKKAAKKAGARPAKKAGAKKVAKKAGARPAKKAAKKVGAKKAGKRAAGNGAAPKKASKRASKGTSRKQPAPTTTPPPANP
jgi:3-methyladenine DNA glycosylase AlkD